MLQPVYTVLPEGSIYFEARSMELVTARGHALVEHIRSGPMLSPSTIHFDVREYLSEHGQAFGSSAVSKSRLDLYNVLSQMTLSDIADRLEQVITVSDYQFKAVKNNDAAAASFGRQLD